MEKEKGVPKNFSKFSPKKFFEIGGKNAGRSSAGEGENGDDGKSRGATFPIGCKVDDQVAFALAVVRYLLI